MLQLSETEGYSVERLGQMLFSSLLCLLRDPTFQNSRQSMTAVLQQLTTKDLNLKSKNISQQQFQIVVLSEITLTTLFTKGN